MLPGIVMPMAGMTEAAIEAVLSAGSTGIDISTLFSAPDWASTVKKRVILPPGVTRGSTVRTTSVLRSGTGRGGLLEFVINGTLEGCGAPATTTFVAGLDGGDVILAEQSGVIILGSGAIKAGGGAGGKGGNGSGTVTQGPFYGGGYLWYYNYYNGFSSIDWGGTRILNEGFGVSSSYAYGGYTYYRSTQQGDSGYETWNSVQRVGPGTTYSGNSGRGQGHDGAKSNGIAGGTNSGMSGNGGDWGASGTAGAAGNAGAGTAAGLAGFALKNTSNITNLFTGTLLGRTG